MPRHGIPRPRGRVRVAVLLAVLALAGLPFATQTLRLDPRTSDAAADTLRPFPGKPAIATLPPVSGDFPFQDALLSWNVDAPEATSFVVELRVRAVDEEPWSAWLHVGDWGAPPDEPRTVRCDGGAIDVDFFRGERRFEAVQVRIRAFAREAGRALVLRRLTLCLSDRERSVAPLPALEPRPFGRVLDVPSRSQRAEDPTIAARICSPTSLAMLLEYRGAPASTAAVAARAFDPAHDIYGNWPRNVQAAWTFGVPGYLTRMSDWAEVERSIAEGQPLVVSIAARQGELAGAPYERTGGHLLVLVGFDERGDCVVNDPAAGEAATVRRVYRRSELESAWMGRGGTCYVLLPKQ